MHAHRKRVPDGIGELHLALGGKSCGNHILGDPAAHVGCGTIDLRRVLSGKRTATMTTGTAVGIHDDLATG